MEGDGTCFLMDTMVATGKLKCTTKAKRDSKVLRYLHTKAGLREAKRIIGAARAKP
jgi:hypothetical protein